VDGGWGVEWLLDEQLRGLGKECKRPGGGGGLVIKEQKFLKDVTLNFEGELYIFLLKRSNEVRSVCRHIVFVVLLSSTYLFTVGVEGCYFHLITLRHTPQSAGLLWTRDRPVAETSTWQHEHCTRDKHPCPRRDLNPRSQQAFGRRPTP
jgi:hypothetical protein